MKRFKSLFIMGTMLILSCNITACSSDTDKTNNEYQEMIENPQISSSTAGGNNESDIAKDNSKRLFDISNGDNLMVYVPTVKNKIPGVLYLDDYYSWYTGEMSTDYDDVNSYYYKTNMPSGTIADYGVSFSHMGISKADFVVKDDNGNEVQYTDERNELYSLIGKHRVWNKIIGDSEYAEKIDIQAFSLALYEDRYSEIPNIKLSFYGIDENNYDEYSKINKNGIQSFLENEIYEDYINGKQVLEPLGTFSLSESGVKYVDYKELSKGKNYKNIIAVTELDKYIEGYSFIINGSFGYKIVDNDAYLKWKADNAEKLFQ